MRHHCASVTALDVPASTGTGERTALPVSRKVRLSAVAGIGGTKFGPTQPAIAAAATTAATVATVAEARLVPPSVRTRCMATRQGSGRRKASVAVSPGRDGDAKVRRCRKYVGGINARHRRRRSPSSWK